MIVSASLVSQSEDSIISELRVKKISLASYE